MTAIVILGAAVWADGPSPTLVRRTAHGAALFHAIKDACIIPCGGDGIHPPSEAEAMRKILVEANVPESAIHKEANSTTTYENLRNAKHILSNLNINEVLVVTDRYHAPRAVMIARALGLKAKASAPQNADVRGTVRLRRLWHEALAFPIYAVRLPFWIRRDRKNQNWLRNIN